MLLDLQRHVLDVDLLDHSRQDRRHGLQVMPATGTEIEAIVDRRAVDRLRGEGGAFVLGVTRLSADTALLLTFRRLRLGRLDDVRGRWLGGGRGILRAAAKLPPGDGRQWPQAPSTAPLEHPTAPASADNSGKTSVPWLSWLAMLHPGPSLRNTGERLPGKSTGTRISFASALTPTGAARPRHDVARFRGVHAPALQVDRWFHPTGSELPRSRNPAASLLILTRWLTIVDYLASSNPVTMWMLVQGISSAKGEL